MTESNTESNIAAARRIHAQLAERWPALFNEKKPVPLAIGISDALLEAMPDATATQLRRALGGWCKRPRYLATLAAGADRHGLEGVQGTVTEEQAADAAERFKAIQAAFQEKDEAKRQANIARLAEARKKAEKLEAQKANPVKQSEPPAPPKPAPAAATAAPKPAGPVIIMKKRRVAQPATE